MRSPPPSGSLSPRSPCVVRRPLPPLPYDSHESLFLLNTCTITRQEISFPLSKFVVHAMSQNPFVRDFSPLPFPAPGVVFISSRHSSFARRLFRGCLGAIMGTLKPVSVMTFLFLVFLLVCPSGGEVPLKPFFLRTAPPIRSRRVSTRPVPPLHTHIICGEVPFMPPPLLSLSWSCNVRHLEMFSTP